MDHSMEVLFFKKYDRQPGERLIYSDYNGRHNGCHWRYYAHDNGCMGTLLMTSRRTGSWWFCLWLKS